LAVPPSPPQSVTAKGSFVRKIGSKNVKFRLIVQATEREEEDSLAVTVTKKRRGNGSKLTEEHSWAHNLEAGSVVIADDLSSASIDTGNDLGSWGHVEFEFNATGPQYEAACDPHVKRRRGEASVPPGATFNFKTGNSVFGALKSVPVTAVASKGTCQQLLLRGNEGCPRKEKLLTGGGGNGSGAAVYLTARRSPGAAKAFVRMTYYEPALDTFFSVEVDGRVPAHSLRVRKDLRPAVFEPAGAPFLDGKVFLADSGPRYSSSPTDCDTAKQYRYVSRDGKIGGALRMKATGFPTVVMDDGLAESSLLVQKTVVENAP
jgi:hypothetical protein